MTCAYHATPVEDCVGCLGRWDRTMAERAIKEHHVYGIEASTLRMAIAEIDRMETERSLAVTERLGAVASAEQLAKRCEALEGMIGTTRDAAALRRRLRSLRARVEDQREADLDEAAATYATMRAELEALRCNDLDAFHDGELEPARRAAFERHLGTCAECEAGLQDLMYVDMVASTSPVDSGPPR